MTILINPVCNSHCSCQAGNTVYVAGLFTTIGGQSRIGLAALDTSGSADLAWDPAAGNINSYYPYVIISYNSLFYVAGIFSAMGSNTRNALAAIDIIGSVQTWNPDAGAGGFVFSMCVDNSSSIFYVGGTFTSLGGNVRTHAGAVHADGTIQTWAPVVTRGFLVPAIQAIAVHSGIVYFGGIFDTVNGNARNNAAAVSTAGAIQAWNPNTDDTVRAIAIDPATGLIYIGGTFTTVSGGTARTGIACFDSAGVLQAFNPTFSFSFGTPAVYTMAIDNGIIYIGGLFDDINGSTRNFLAAIATDGTLQSWDPNANASVNNVTVIDTDVYIGGVFTTLGGFSLSYCAKVGTDGIIDSNFITNPDDSALSFAIAS